MSTNETPPAPAHDEVSVVQLAKAVRFAFVCLAVILSGVAIRLALMLKASERLFEDMLGAGTQLPLISQYVFMARIPTLLISVAIPLVCMATLFQRKMVRAIYILAGMILLSLVLSTVLWQAISLPFFEVMRRMVGGV